MIKEEEKKENKNQKPESESGSQTDNTAKVTITKEAESLMSELVKRVNDGFEFGRLNRHQLMSWILVKFAGECSEPDVRAIRADHFDEIALLELSFKKLKQAGVLPPELRKMLLSQAGMDEIFKKIPKRPVDSKVNQ